MNRVMVFSGRPSAATTPARVWSWPIRKCSYDMTAIVCDSAEMSMTEDKTMLIFTMHNGQQFRNFTEGEVNPRQKKEFVPYSRENFTKKTMMVPYDANFNRMDEEVIEGSSTSNYVSKNLAQLGGLYRFDEDDPG